MSESYKSRGSWGSYLRGHLAKGFALISNKYLITVCRDKNDQGKCGVITVSLITTVYASS